MESTKRLLTQVVVNSTRPPTTNVPASAFTTLSSLASYAQARSDRDYEASVARDIEATKGALTKFVLNGVVAGASPVVMTSPMAKEAVQAVRMPVAGLNERLTLFPDAATGAFANASSSTARSIVRILLQSAGTRSSSTASFALPSSLNSEKTLSAVIKVQSSPWKSSGAVNVVPGTALVGLTIFKSGSDVAVTSFAAPVRVTVPVPPPPAGKVAKIVFWDAATGKYSDAGCTAVASSKSSEAVADCSHLTDFGVVYVDVSSVTVVCGNRAVESGEECDDGNTVSGDGCSSTCRRELAAIDKLKQALSESPLLAIALGAGIGGLVLILISVSLIKRKYGRVMFCFKSSAVAPAPNDDAVKPSPLSSSQHNVNVEKLDLKSGPAASASVKGETMPADEFAARMQPVSKPH